MARVGGLGKGMAALLHVKEPADDKREYFLCPIELIRPNKSQPRKNFAPDKLEELAESIREQAKQRGLEELFEQVLVPTEKVIELGKGGAKRTTTRKFYPGYIMLRMTMTDFSWHLVQSIPKVTGFVGGKNRPAPMKDEEAARILSLMETRQEQPRPKFSFERGDDVRVIDGPFGGFNGVVEDVNYDKGKLRVSVSIFGRQTPVELDFIQVSKG